MIVGYTKSFSQDYAIVFDSITNTYKFNRDLNYAIGKKMCDFKAISLNGNTISNDQLIGKVTVVNLWFEGCAPCITELDFLSDLYNKYRNNRFFNFFSFTVDNVEVARKSVNKYNILFTVCPVSRELAYEMNFNFGFPTNMIINRKGEVVFFKTGGPLEKERAEKEIAKMDDIIAQLLLNEN